MNVLHITSHLSYSGANKELAALAFDQRDRGDRVRVCCLAARGPWGERFEAEGVSTIVLGGRRWFDLMPAWRLRELLGTAEIDLVQLWGPAALHWVGVLKPSLLPRAIYCPPLPHERQSFARWLLSRTGRIVVRDETEKNQAIALGGRRESVVVAAPGVGAVAAPSRLVKETAWIAGVGPLEKPKNFRGAIWTMDIINEIFPLVELELVGQGSERDDLLEFSWRFQRAKVRFAGPCDDLSARLTDADLGWLTARDGCRHAALEAMAAGLPVVASRLPHLCDMIPDGEAGFLIAPGDKIALARKTRTLLLDPDLRARMGAAGRRHVRERYSMPAFLERWRDVLRAA
jgi:glycosyltransferase involved in cell wall biosynthesis